MGHGFVVPVVLAWILWKERSRWRATKWQPSSWGLAILLLGASLHFVAAVGGGLFAGCVAFLVSLAGAVVWLGGFGLLRALAFPFLLALFMLPKLAVVYNQATLPLQLLASRLAAGGLGSVGLGVLRDGNILQVNGHRVAVEEACNGIRYLLPLAFLSLVYGYVSGAKPWLRIALLAASIPLAIFGNALRVAAAAFDPALEAGMLHMLAGLIVFLICLGGLAGLRWLGGKLSEPARV
jgi:exosortase